jgi:hypothetical protein
VSRVSLSLHFFLISRKALSNSSFIQTNYLQKNEKFAF